MTDFNGIKIEPKIILPKLQFGRAGKDGQGGEGGSIMIIAEEIIGDGQIIANGGDGTTGGKGGSVHIQAIKNNFKGKISAKGGDSNGKKRTEGRR